MSRPALSAWAGPPFRHSLGMRCQTGLFSRAGRRESVQAWRSYVLEKSAAATETARWRRRYSKPLPVRSFRAYNLAAPALSAGPIRPVGRRILRESHHDYPDQ